MITTVRAMYFSATDTTKTVVELIADTLAKLGGFQKLTTDFTLPGARQEAPAITDNELVVFGTPVYAGRVSNVLLKYLATVKGNGALAVPVVCYGNRNFDDGLIELRNILEGNGFHTIAGAAFIGEHSFSRILAAGRPDAQDRALAVSFAEKVYDKLTHASQEALMTPAAVKGEDPIRPYYTPRDRQGNPVNILKVKPLVDMSKCTGCGICAEVCPMGSIIPENIAEYTGICIKCGACEKKCPTGARYYEDAGYIYHRTELELGYARRAEPEFFL